MFDLEREFINLMNTYGISIEIKDQLLFDAYLTLFDEIWQSLPDDEPIAFFGFSAAFTLMRRRVDFSQKKVVCVIDNSMWDESVLHGLPLIRSEELARYSPKHIILTALKWRAQMREDVLRFLPGAQIIDLYETLEQRGYNYDGFSFWGPPSPYIQIEQARQVLQHQIEGTAAHAHALEQLAQEHLRIRDFVYAQKYFLQYIHLGYDTNGHYTCLLADLEALFTKVRWHMNQKSTNDLTIFLLDAASHPATRGLPNISRLERDSLCLTNAYASCMHTKAALFTMFSGKSYVRDELYAQYYLREKDSSFLQELHRRGGVLKHIRPYGLLYLEGVSVNAYQPTPSVIQPRIYWNYLCDALQETRDCVTILHSLETHSPYFNGGGPVDMIDCLQTFRTDTYKELFDGSEAEQRLALYRHERAMHEDALRYSDAQLGFYTSILSNRQKTIVMCDHGADMPRRRYLPSGLIDEDLAWDDPRMLLMLRSHSIPSGEHTSLFSGQDLASVMRSMLWEDEITIPQRDWVPVEYEPCYGRSIELYKETNTPYSSAHSGFCKIRNDTEMFTQYFDGAEEYCQYKEGIWVAADPTENRLEQLRGSMNIDRKAIWGNIFRFYPVAIDYFRDKIDPKYLPEAKQGVPDDG